MDFEDLDGAEKEAVRGARSIMSAEVLEGSLLLDQAIEIWNSAGACVRSVGFGEVLDIIMRDSGSSAPMNESKDQKSRS